MPYETGGRADKYGNYYETRIVIYYLLKLIEEDIIYLKYEPLGELEKGVDLWVQYKNDVEEGIQCKSRNGSKSAWDFISLKNNYIFKKWLTHLNNDCNCMVSLVSPINCIILEDLINRAKTNYSVTDFYKYQICQSGKKLIEFFDKFCQEIGIKKKDYNNPYTEKELYNCINYLKRICIRQLPDSELKNIIFEKIRTLFSTDSTKVYSIFVDFVVNVDCFGRKITQNQIYDLIDKNNFLLRSLSNDQKIIPRIIELNHEYRKCFTKLKNGFFINDKFQECKKNIELGNSLIIHGEAGVGKSGCIENIIEYCEIKKIQYFAIKLDNKKPLVNLEEWGKSLGFSSSIAHCFDSVTKHDKAVIIFDQLDTLRWTNGNSNDSLFICFELIKQIINLNLN